MQMSNNAKIVNILDSQSGIDYSPESFTNVIFGSNVVSIDVGCCKNCINLYSAVFKDKIQWIGDEAFYNCSSLNNVAIPNECNFIGSQAFYNCSNISSLTLPTATAHYGDRCFSKCGPANVKIDLSSSSGVEMFNESNIRSAVVAGEMKSKMFYGCSQLKSAEIKTSTTIPNQTFQNCTNLVNVKLAPTIATIGSSAFHNCSNLKSLDGLKDTKITQLNARFIYGTSNLKELQLPATLTDIDKFDANCFDHANLDTVYCNGMTSEYMIDHKDDFNRFGNSHDIKFVSNSGRIFELNDGSELKTQTFVHAISIALAKSRSNELLDMWKDANSLEKHLKSMYGNDYTNCINLIKRQDNNPEQHCTVDMAKSLLEDAVSKKDSIDLMMFHFSDHGGAGSPGYLCMYSGDFGYDLLNGYLENFSNVFVMLCNCRPFSGVDVTALENRFKETNTKCLVWAPCKPTQDSCMNPGQGHELMNTLGEVLTKYSKKMQPNELTWAFVWEKIANTPAHTGNLNSPGYSARQYWKPTKYNLNGFNENVPLFNIKEFG